MLIGRLIKVRLLEHGMFVRQRCSVFEARLAALRVTGQVVVWSSRNPFNLVELTAFFAFGKETIEKVRSRLGVMRKLVRRLNMFFQIIGTNAVFVVPANAIGNPATVHLFVLSGHDEVFDFHLLELAYTKDEVLRRDLVSISLADLGNAERQFSIRRVEDVLEVDENALSGLRTKVGHVVIRLDGADRRFAHQVERDTL